MAALDFRWERVIALMLASGQALQEYGVRRARRSLSLLADWISRMALVVADSEAAMARPVDEITIGCIGLVRNAEVLPLDGELLSERALVDECSLTGEPYVVDKVRAIRCAAEPSIRVHHSDCVYAATRAIQPTARSLAC